jgi:hypothetical protein
VSTGQPAAAAALAAALAAAATAALAAVSLEGVGERDCDEDSSTKLLHNDSIAVVVAARNIQK